MTSKRTLALVFSLTLAPLSLGVSFGNQSSGATEHSGILIPHAPTLPPSPAPSAASGFEHALNLAEGALERGDLLGARDQIRRAQERDPNATSAWALRVRWAHAAGDEDEEVYALHRQLALSEAQELPKKELKALRERVLEIDPFAEATFGLRERFVEKLSSLAEKYEGEDRPHSAIRVHKQVLALDPENAESTAAIDRIASAPDPSLAGDAKPRDLLADVSAEWVAEHDQEHLEWKERAILKRENYVTHTNASTLR